MLVLNANLIAGVVVRMGTDRNRQQQGSQGKRCAEKAEHGMGQYTFRPYRFTVRLTAVGRCNSCSLVDPGQSCEGAAQRKVAWRAPPMRCIDPRHRPSSLRRLGQR